MTAVIGVVCAPDRSLGMPPRMPLAADFSRAPFLVIWEVTRACALACVHCRADAIPCRDPRELSTAEGLALVDQVCAFGDPAPLLVLTGGDPMRRPDLATLVCYASQAGLTVALTPSGTAAATKKRLAELGRGASLEQVTPEECERVLNYLYDLSLTSRFGVKTTEAPHYQRVVRQREAQRERDGLPSHAIERRRQLRAPRSVNDGNGFVFIDHVGGICPSGFLPMVRGNVRSATLRDVYCDDEAFRRLRHADGLRGNCGRCEFREVCGGSRSRSFASTGALMGSDPLCVYDPGPEVRPVVPMFAPPITGSRSA